MEFDLDAYKRRTAKLDWSDLDLDAAFAAQPLDGPSLRCLRYMHDVEFHTVCYLRDLLLTPAHADPEVTAFLSFWAFEEYWHGEALAAVLSAHGIRAGAPRVAALRRRLGSAALGPAATMAAGAVLKGDFVAVHMTWGAVNEWSTQAGYGRLSQLAGHPVLSELVARIMRQEGRHIDFYASQAERRLAASGVARRATRLALRRLWRPVGSGVMPAEETAFLVRHLFGGDDGLAVVRRIDRRVDRLPGLAGLGIAERARDQAVGEATAPVTRRAAAGVVPAAA